MGWEEKKDVIVRWETQMWRTFLDLCRLKSCNNGGSRLSDFEADGRDAVDECIKRTGCSLVTRNVHFIIYKASLVKRSVNSTV